MEINRENASRSSRRQRSKDTERSKDTDSGRKIPKVPPKDGKIVQYSLRH